MRRLRPSATTASRPFVADIAAARAAFHGFERAVQDRQDARLLARIEGPDLWLAHAGRSTEAAFSSEGSD
jgi:hypothetical protein